MKVFISADIEGVAGITSWDETNKNHSDYEYFKIQMSKEVAAACEGANECGAKEIYIKDAHASGRNIIPDYLPENAYLIRGWSGDPLSMVEGIDDSFDALIFIGYHSPAGSNDNPLAHTINGSSIRELRLNGNICSEFLLHGYGASYFNVPIAFISGDKGICEYAKSYNDNIETVATNIGTGFSSMSIQPQKALRLIKDGVKEGLKDLENKKLILPEEFTLEVEYNRHGDAYEKSFYPNAKLKDNFTIEYKNTDYYEILRARAFLI